jgi:hypothetical protein
MSNTSDPLNRVKLFFTFLFGVFPEVFFRGGAHFSLLLLISKHDNFVLVLSHSIPTIKYALIVLYPCYSKLTSHDVSAKGPK